MKLHLSPYVVCAISEGSDETFCLSLCCLHMGQVPKSDELAQMFIFNVLTCTSDVDSFDNHSFAYVKIKFQ